MESLSQDEKILYTTPIADPLATEKLTAKLLQLTTKLAKVKLIRRGVKEVNKAFRKKELGICILAADVSPVDVICHIPILCEKSKVPYAYIKSREALGVSSLTKRPTSVVMLLKPPADSKYRESFDKLLEVVRMFNPYMITK